MQKYCLLIGLMCAFSPALPAGVLLSVAPAGGAVSGQPGGVTGWGFTLSNDVDYAVVNSATLIGDNGPLGKFTDFISANFIVIGPDGLFAQSSWSQGFDEIAQTGLGSFQIAAGAQLGDTLATTIQVFYNLFSRSPLDPDFNLDTDPLGGPMIATVDVSVSATAPSEVPEPSTWVLLGTGLLAAGGMRRRQVVRLHVVEAKPQRWSACFTHGGSPGPANRDGDGAD